jgi:hypothetical protein
MYVRFVTSRTDEDSGVSQGLFQAAYRLRDAQELAEHEGIWFDEVVGWFEKHLPSPDPWQLGRSGCARRRVVFWFRATAAEHVRRMQHLVVMLRHHGIASRMLRSRAPGRVLYQDEHQVGAIPFRDAVASSR